MKNIANIATNNLPTTAAGTKFFLLADLLFQDFYVKNHPIKKINITKFRYNIIIYHTHGK